MTRLPLASLMPTRTLTNIPLIVRLEITLITKEIIDQAAIPGLVSAVDLMMQPPKPLLLFKVGTIVSEDGANCNSSK